MYLRYNKANLKYGFSIITFLTYETALHMINQVQGFEQFFKSICKCQAFSREHEEYADSLLKIGQVVHLFLC